MLREGVERCPDGLWDGGAHANSVWQLRHVQHHAAQIADRLRSEADIGVRWVGGSRPR